MILLSYLSELLTARINISFMLGIVSLNERNSTASLRAAMQCRISSVCLMCNVATLDNLVLRQYCLAE